MSILDCVEVWLSSLRSIFESAGVAVIFSRSTDGRPNPSCAVNLRLGPVEADLVVWESGEAELAMIGPVGAAEQTHFDDIRDVNKLAAVMARMAEILSTAHQ
jgi:hypothetical protein